MPSAAVTSSKLGVTVNPPDTALSRVTVNVIVSPSLADASATVTSAAGVVTVIVKSSVTGAFTPSSAVIVTVWAPSVASGWTVPLT